MEAMSQNANEKKVAPKTNGAAEGNVDQIRDILFGGQMRDYDRRFDELDERSKRDLERLRVDMQKRIESLETLLKDSAERQSQQLKKLDSEQKLNAENAAAATDKLGKSLRTELSEVDEKFEHSTSSLRERLHKLASETADSMRANHEEISSLIERMGHGLRDEKVAREELAGFFTEMALRLNRQFDLPKN
jgi:hypothetical protein